MFASLLFAAGTVNAWGDRAHRMVGQLAQELLTEEAKAQLQLIIPEYNGKLEYATLWADEVKSRTHPENEKYRYASILHYVDKSLSDPTKKDCQYIDDRDCADNNCIVGAIGNYTTRLATCDADQETKNEAVKFLAHLVGDLTMPLHVLGYKRGGNDIPAVFDGQTKIDGFNVNLHNTWDYHIPNKDIKSNHEDKQESWLKYLMEGIESGKVNKNEAIGEADMFEKTASGNSAAAAVWAMESTKFNCEFVFPPFFDNPTADLGGKYYEDLYFIADIQVARAGIRLAEIINQAIGKCTVKSTTQDSHSTTDSATTTIHSATITTQDSLSTTDSVTTTTVTGAASSTIVLSMTQDSTTQTGSVTTSITPTDVTSCSETPFASSSISTVSINQVATNKDKYSRRPGYTSICNDYQTSYIAKTAYPVPTASPQSTGSYDDILSSSAKSIISTSGILVMFLI